MTTDLTKKRIIKYLNKDFDSLKRDLIEHVRIYYKDTAEDFNSSSTNVMLIELLAYIGDNLSFYLDKKFDESFIHLAKEKKNILKHAKQLGFKPFGKTSARGKADFFIEVPARTVNEKIIPDIRYAGTLQRGAQVRGENGQIYETIATIDFSDLDISDSDIVRVSQRDTSTNVPTKFVLRYPNVDIIGGETKSTTFEVNNYQAFREFELPDEDVLEIMSIQDSEGNTWYEVDYLAQDTVFTSQTNTHDDSTDVPYLLKLQSVPYRFKKEYDIETNKTKIIFGSGDAEAFDGDLIPNVGDLSLPVYGKENFTDFTIDPQNFLKTRTLGLAPVNTTLTVQYRVGGGIQSNAGSNQIREVSDFTLTIADNTLSDSIKNQVRNSMAVLNPKAVQGGREQPSVEELVEVIPASFSSQSRLVTREDFVARVLSMPPKFGSVFRVSAKNSVIGENAVELIILSRDSDGYVTTAPSSLKENIKKYLQKFKMLTDTIDILDGDVMNLGINFSVVSEPGFGNKNEILSTCISVLEEYFDIRKWQIGQPINLTDIYCLLGDIPGVYSVYDLSVVNKAGTIDSRNYSNTRFNVQENTESNIIRCPNNAIFEIKFPPKDIKGKVR